MFELKDITTYLGKNLTFSLFYIIGAFICQAIATYLIKKIIYKIAEQQEKLSVRTGLSSRLQTLQGLLINTSAIVIWGMAIIMLLAEWGVDITPLITGAGVVGLAVGFGAQTLVRDLVSGFFILFENQFNVGERIQIAGITGVVQSINLRTTMIKDDNGSTHILPNSMVTNVTKNLPPVESDQSEPATE